MANHLGMAMIHAILTLHQRGWSKRRIARELGVDRGAVAAPGDRPMPPAGQPAPVVLEGSGGSGFKSSHLGGQPAPRVEC